MKRVQVICLLFWYSASLWGQVISVCDPETAPASVCTEACLLCDLDGLSRTLNKDNTLATGVLECRTGVGDLYAFVAMSTDIKIEVNVQDCNSVSRQDISYLSFFGYRDPDGTCLDEEFGETLSSIFPCDDENVTAGVQWIAPNSQKEFENIDPLTIGQIYYVAFGVEETSDCSYSVQILEGDTKVPELTDIFTLSPTNLPCLGETIVYEVQDTIPITQYLFTLNGDTISTTDTASVTFDTPGMYELCISGRNYCTESPQNCYSIPISSTAITTVTDFLCPETCYELSPDSVVCQPGTYPITFSDQNGCDSTVMYEILAAQVDTTLLAANLCLGDTLSFAGRTYFTSGNFEIRLTNQFGCDSILSLQVNVANCPLSGSITDHDLSCFGAGAEGSFSFTVVDGTPPFSYTYARLGGGVSGNGTIIALNTATEVQGLPIGTYLIEIADFFGNQGFFNTEISEPLALTLVVNTSNYNGFEIACAEDANGEIALLASGGTPPYTLSWLDMPGGGMIRQNLSAGTYVATLQDQNGCLLNESIPLAAPTPLSLNADPIDETCDQPNSGAIREIVATGGIAPYQYQLNQNGSSVSPNDFLSLSAGNYLLSTTDANACTAELAFEISAPTSAQVEILGPTAPIPLGESTIVEVVGSQLNSINWEPNEIVGCLDCASTVIRPLRSIWVKAETLSIDGCMAVDSIYVQVRPNRNIFIPNAFSPNNDGINDVLQIYPANSVEKVMLFTVFDRWGNQLYQAENLSVPFDPFTGWDGSNRNRAANPGIYIWLAQIQYIDGSTEVMKGDVLLIR